MHKDQGTA